MKNSKEICRGHELSLYGKDFATVNPLLAAWQNLVEKFPKLYRIRYDFTQRFDQNGQPYVTATLHAVTLHQDFTSSYFVDVYTGEIIE